MRFVPPWIRQCRQAPDDRWCVNEISGARVASLLETLALVTHDFTARYSLATVDSWQWTATIFGLSATVAADLSCLTLIKAA
ncbi:MAG TPA: hypothetical protein DCY79_16395 [Planctomycetaceae bacterium]|nr:hypothetical protein [Blastopirellula sp.]HAY81386.1 hypothetical protein [Planctomycetaceae bacterium]